MRKESLICFRASKDLHESLAKVAKEGQRSLSATIEMVLTNYLKERKAFRSAEKEKRHYPRKTISVPAVVSQQERGLMGIGAITDISLGGVKLLIHREAKNQVLIDSQGSRFEVAFNLPTENRPIRLSCEAARVVEAEDSTQVGAFFVDADFKGYKSLQSYLM